MRRFERGTVVLLDLNPTAGHELRGLRPAVIVSDPEVTMDQRFSMMCVIPLTGTAGEGALYPRLEPGGSGLRKVSWALVDQLRSVGKRRTRRVYGHISEEELEAIDEGLRLYLSL